MAKIAVSTSRKYSAGAVMMIASVQNANKQLQDNSHQLLSDGFEPSPAEYK